MKLPGPLESLADWPHGPNLWAPPLKRAIGAVACKKKAVPSPCPSAYWRTLTGQGGQLPVQLPTEVVPIFLLAGFGTARLADHRVVQ